MVIKLCFYQKIEVANQDFVVPVTAGVPVWCGEVCCGVVSGDDKPMCPGLCACMCWRPVKGQRPRAGSVLGGWMGWKLRIKKKKNTQLVEHVCQINETNTNKTSRHLIQPRSVCVSLSDLLFVPQKTLLLFSCSYFLLFYIFGSNECCSSALGAHTITNPARKITLCSIDSTGSTELHLWTGSLSPAFMNTDQLTSYYFYLLSIFGIH